MARQAHEDHYPVDVLRTPRMQTTCAVVHPRVLAAWGLEEWTPIELTNVASGDSVVVWLVARLQPFAREPDRAIWRTLFLSGSLFDQLAPDGTRAFRGRISFASESMRVLPALRNTVLTGDEVQISSANAEGRKHVVITANGTVMWARVVPGDESWIRLSQHGRTLMSLGPAEFGMLPAVLVSSIRSTPPQGDLRSHDFKDTARRWIRATVRLPLFLLEWLVRLVVRAPSVALRTSEAEVGDDTEGVVRLASEVFPLIGADVGDEVVVEWGGRSVTGIALPHIPTTPDISSGDMLMIAPTHRRDDQMPTSHLRAGVTIGMRNHLGIPRRAVVRVRRRAIPVLTSRLNQLVLPVGGLIVGALAVADLSGELVAWGIAVIVLLTLLPARMRKPRDGGWR